VYQGELMGNDYYHSLSINFIAKQGNLREEVKAKAINNFFCQGIKEFSMDEKEVDEALGEKAFSGGSIPRNVLDEIESGQISKDDQRITFYFYEGFHEENANNFKAYLKENHPVLDFKIQKNNWVDWNREWRKFYKKITISPRLSIIPEWERNNWEDRKGLVFIYPGMGFGTGDHETTFLCLQLFDELTEHKNFSSSYCLDFGCGSGILGMSVLKLSSMDVDFCDIDIEALDNCKQNLEINFSSEELNGQRLVSRERFIPETKYNLVFANILEHILLEEKNLLKKCLNENGLLIISGILIDQKERVKKEFCSLGLQLKKEQIKGQWAALLFENSGKYEG
jgi:ribosomal protein L11 methyltransferase